MYLILRRLVRRTGVSREEETLPLTLTEPLAKHPNLKLELTLVETSLSEVSFEVSVVVTSIWKSTCTSSISSVGSGTSPRNGALTCTVYVSVAPSTGRSSWKLNRRGVCFSTSL